MKINVIDFMKLVEETLAPKSSWGKVEVISKIKDCLLQTAEENEANPKASLPSEPNTIDLNWEQFKQYTEQLGWPMSTTLRYVGYFKDNEEFRTLVFDIDGNFTFKV